MWQEVIDRATENLGPDDKMRIYISQALHPQKVTIPLKEISYFTPEKIMDHIEKSNIEFAIEKGFTVDVGTINMSSLGKAANNAAE